MRLYMLGLLVFWNMFEEGLFVGKTFVAGVALVGFICLVAPGMGLQVGQLRERLRATCNRNKKSTFYSNMALERDKPEIIYFILFTL